MSDTTEDLEAATNAGFDEGREVGRAEGAQSIREAFFGSSQGLKHVRRKPLHARETEETLLLNRSLEAIGRFQTTIAGHVALEVLRGDLGSLQSDITDYLSRTLDD